ncbi:hypothetical protein [Roseococcus sp. YIM B11640]|uniref:hypothetical protein n=1 Tax=Roseococcus sp. YIM B11640 TaxID=3133973 RepID=UPI003C7AED2A
MKRPFTPYLLAGLLALPVAAFAQGGSSDTPRPPGSDPSATVSRQTGMPSAPPGSTGNPTGTPSGRAPDPAPNMAVTPARPGSAARQDPGGPAIPGQVSPGAPNAPGSRTN